jgi:hypothetical protein
MDEEVDRREVVADVLRPVLEDGEQYKVFCQDGEIFVEDTDTSVCAARHPRLYGRLLALDAQLGQAGLSAGNALLLLGLAFCAGVALGWWNDWFKTEDLRSWWFYFLVFGVLLFVRSHLFAALQRGMYARQRDELLSLVAAEGLDRDRLLPLVEGDPSVARIAFHLKLDGDVPISREPSRVPGERGA